MTFAARDANGNIVNIETPLFTENNVLLTAIKADLDTLATLTAAMKTDLDNLSTVASSTAVSSTRLDTASIANDTATLTPKFAKIAASSSGDNTLVAAVTSKKLRVLSYNLIANGAVNGKFVSDVSGGSPVDLTGLKYMPAAGNGIAANFSPVGLFETVAGKALVLNLSGAVAVGGELTYVEV